MIEKGFRYSPALAAALCLILSVMTPSLGSAETLRLGFENESELLGDFVSEFKEYLPLGTAGLEKRQISIGEGKFGKGLHIADGWPVSKGTWNESGLDCDLIVATMWGEWRTKPHYWGTGAFQGDSGSLAFWVKKETLHPGIVFMQGHIGWGRAERDLFNIEVDEEGRLHAFIRDVQYRYHRVKSDAPIWEPGEWQHIAAVWDRAHGIKIYHNGLPVGSTWGEDAWWKTGQPGLFSPFLPESHYDEIVFFDFPLTDMQVRELFETNRVTTGETRLEYGEWAVRRLSETFADFDQIEIPTYEVGSQSGLTFEQILPEECADGSVSAWWAMDGRYELAWPHPYRLFTFILGDVDFKGTVLDLRIPEGSRPNYVSFEGVLDEVELRVGGADVAETSPLLATGGYSPFFHSAKIEVPDAVTNLTIPLVKGYGSPPGLEGSAHLPLTGETRIHEMTLWNVEPGKATSLEDARAVRWLLSAAATESEIPRYGAALRKIASQRSRAAVVSSRTGPKTATSVTIHPMTPVHLFSPGIDPDLAVDRVHIRLTVVPEALEDILWIRFRDPKNPSRFWAQTCLRVKYASTEDFQTIDLDFDLADLMLAAEDRLWVEVESMRGVELILGHPEKPSALTAILSKDVEASIGGYAQNQLRAAQLQFSKEYNYRPWTLTGEEVSLTDWSQLGGPYDMAYPVLAALRHDPDHPLGKIYEEMVFQRGRRAWVPQETVKRPVRPDAPDGAPEWAIWERELIRINKRVTHWTADRQRPDGQFWGGWNDDSFIPLGFPAMPLLGDAKTKKAWLRFYDGLEEAGIFADGYCDIWPIDPLHITDYIVSRGLMLAFGLGDPKVVEREMRTAERYADRVAETNLRLKANGAQPLVGNPADRKREDVTLVEQMESEILLYSQTHLNWYFGKSPDPGPFSNEDLEGLTRRMRDAVLRCDSITEFDFTESMIHTDGQGEGIGRNELIAAALGGTLQGRIGSEPHTISATWEGEEAVENLARLVEYADNHELRVRFYNFSETPILTNLRVWRLGSGTYTLRFEPVDPNSGAFSASDASSETRDLRRFSTVEVKVPPRVECRLTVLLEKETERPILLPDLAVGKGGVRLAANGDLSVDLSNIGGADAGPFRVAVEVDGNRVAEQAIPGLASPANDFRPRRGEVRFTRIPTGGRLVVRIDSENEVDEILEENNEFRAGL